MCRGRGSPSDLAQRRPPTPEGTSVRSPTLQLRRPTSSQLNELVTVGTIIDRRVVFLVIRRGQNKSGQVFQRKLSCTPSERALRSLQSIERVPEWSTTAFCIRGSRMRAKRYEHTSL